ncbi:carbohydrate kinase family protein [Mucilaginibacter sp. SP1R1]|uniref:carbohydrate kinase family protein n=1 Tax=Mucilaginibacter sp. SP1R1 TaxID=2723091 RepID=UPI001622E26F|nr:carbohydrate kinase [Mucilaginibacter sp. SP1R1]MBB6149099.1 fructokinase [Mucilaginibacter sp. SP1R1]
MNNITANPVTPAICYGEILWDVLPDGPQPGGAPLNVAYHLNKLGMATSLVSKIGDDANGQKLEKLLDNWGIKKHLLQVDHEHPTSQVLARMNNGNEVSYEIVFPVAWDFISESQTILNELKPSTYFVFGSLASRNDVSRNTLFELLQTDAIKVFDINIRPPFISRDLLGELLTKADIVKFNQAELEMVQGFFRGSFWKEAEQIKFIQDHFNVPEIIVTKGEFGASYYKHDKAYHVAGREVKVNDTIGSGDSFLAAFIANHYRGEPPQTLLKNAIAMGGFIATKKGGCPEYQLEEYLNFKNQIF